MRSLPLSSDIILTTDADLIDVAKTIPKLNNKTPHSTDGQQWLEINIINVTPDIVKSYIVHPTSSYRIITSTPVTSTPASTFYQGNLQSRDWSYNYDDNSDGPASENDCYLYDFIRDDGVVLSINDCLSIYFTIEVPTLEVPTTTQSASLKPVKTLKFEKSTAAATIIPTTRKEIKTILSTMGKDDTMSIMTDRGEMVTSFIVNQKLLNSKLTTAITSSTAATTAATTATTAETTYNHIMTHIPAITVTPTVMSSTRQQSSLQTKTIVDMSTTNMRTEVTGNDVAEESSLRVTTTVEAETQATSSTKSGILHTV